MSRHRPETLRPDSEFQLPNGRPVEDPIFQTVKQMQSGMRYPWIVDTRFERVMMLFWVNGQEVAAMDWWPPTQRGEVVFWTWPQLRELLEEEVLVLQRHENPPSPKDFDD